MPTTQKLTAYQKFQDVENVDVSLIMKAMVTQHTLITIQLQKIVDDCICSGKYAVNVVDDNKR